MVGKSPVFKLILVIPTILILLGCYKTSMDAKEAQEVLNAFYTDKVPESINDRHLLNAGKAIVPYLIIEIQKRDMQKRGYAILALGKIGDRRALASLIKILEDPTENYGYHEAALRAIWYIDGKLGEEYARKHEGEHKEVDRTIQLLREGKM